MRRLAFALLAPALLWNSSVLADYRITRDHGGLSAEMKKVKNGPELWAIVDPCPEEFF